MSCFYNYVVFLQFKTLGNSNAIARLFALKHGATITFPPWTKALVLARNSLVVSTSQIFGLLASTAAVHALREEPEIGIALV
jgi:hypothetical protein